MMSNRSPQSTDYIVGRREAILCHQKEKSKFFIVITANWVLIGYVNIEAKWIWSTSCGVVWRFSSSSTTKQVNNNVIRNHRLFMRLLVKAPRDFCVRIDKLLIESLWPEMPSNDGNRKECT